MKVADKGKEKTTFVFNFGTFKVEVMPFGPMHAPLTFKRLKHYMFGNLPFVEVYLDDVVIHFKTFELHIDDIRLVLRRVEKEVLRIKIGKCTFAHDRVDILGLISNGDGVSVDSSQVGKNNDDQTLTNQRELRRFLDYSVITVASSDGLQISPLFYVALHRRITKCKITLDRRDDQNARVIEREVENSCCIGFLCL